jgi:hypothetical protein
MVKYNADKNAIDIDVQGRMYSLPVVVSNYFEHVGQQVIMVSCDNPGIINGFFIINATGLPQSDFELARDDLCKLDMFANYAIVKPLFGKMGPRASYVEDENGEQHALLPEDSAQIWMNDDGNEVNSVSILAPHETVPMHFPMLDISQLHLYKDLAVIIASGGEGQPGMPIAAFELNGVVPPDQYANVAEGFSALANMFSSMCGGDECFADFRHMVGSEVVGNTRRLQMREMFPEPGRPARDVYASIPVVVLN